MEVKYRPIENVWEDVLNNAKLVNVFKEFRGELMNAKEEYGDKVERENTSDRVAGVISEEANELNMVNKIL